MPASLVEPMLQMMNITVRRVAHICRGRNRERARFLPRIVAICCNVFIRDIDTDCLGRRHTIGQPRRQQASADLSPTRSSIPDRYLPLFHEWLRRARQAGFNRWEFADGIEQIYG